MQPNKRRNIRRTPEIKPLVRKVQQKRREPNILKRGIEAMETAERIRQGGNIDSSDLAMALFDLREAIKKSIQLKQPTAGIQLLQADYEILKAEIERRARQEREDIEASQE